MIELGWAICIDEPSDLIKKGLDRRTPQVTVHLDWPSLTADQCRELAAELLKAADIVDGFE